MGAAAVGSSDAAAVVLVVSRGHLPPEELAHLPPDVFTDYVYTAGNSSSSPALDSKAGRSPMRRLFDLARDLHDKVTEGPSMHQQQ
jgi:hypothetical protein